MYATEKFDGTLNAKNYPHGDLFGYHFNQSVHRRVGTAYLALSLSKTIVRLIALRVAQLRTRFHDFTTTTHRLIEHNEELQLPFLKASERSITRMNLNKTYIFRILHRDHIMSNR